MSLAPLSVRLLIKLKKTKTPEAKASGGSYGADNIDCVLLVLEWLRMRVLASEWDEGRGRFALDYLG
ncbi:MAG: hypothetical protein WC028_30625 [Candidatus Obscuribacterales bacterium]